MKNKYAEQILSRITPEERQRYNDNFVKFYRVRYARVARRRCVGYRKSNYRHYFDWYFKCRDLYKIVKPKSIHATK